MRDLRLPDEVLAMNRSGQRIEVRFPFDDPWLNYGPLSTQKKRLPYVDTSQPVTPGQVAQAIEFARQKGWCPTEKGLPLRFAFAAGAFKPEEEA